MPQKGSQRSLNEYVVKIWARFIPFWGIAKPPDAALPAPGETKNRLSFRHVGDNAS
jgi:hypothetical protein